MSPSLTVVCLVLLVVVSVAAGEVSPHDDAQTTPVVGGGDIGGTFRQNISDDVTGFWFSDMHFDPLYDMQYGPVHMCRGSNFKPRGDLILEPHPLVNCRNKIMCRYGQYGCDPPFDMLISMLDYAQSINASPQFILITGDLAAHSLPSHDVTLDAMGTITNSLLSYFPSTKLIPALGNNDMNPHYFIQCGPNPWLQSVLKLWENIIPASQHEFFLRGGYYAKSPSPNLIFIVLNTVYWSAKFDAFPEPPSEIDPCDQFGFLRGQLDLARRRHMKVVITSHVGLGVGRAETAHSKLMKPQYQKKYLEIITPYADVITAQFFAHTHREEIRIVDPERNADGHIVAPVIVAPAIAPIRWNNPVFRQLWYNPTTSIFDDMESYYTDYSADGDVEWGVSYRWSSLFGTDLSPKHVQLVALRLLADNTLFDKWWVVHNGRYPQTDIEGAPGNGCSMRIWDMCSMRCAIRFVLYSSFVKCCNDQSQNNLHMIANYLTAVGMKGSLISAYNQSGKTKGSRFGRGERSKSSNVHIDSSEDEEHGYHVKKKGV